MNNVEKFTLGVLGTSAVVAGVLAARGKKRRAMDHQKPYYKNYHKPSGFYEAHVKRPLDCYLSSPRFYLNKDARGKTGKSSNYINSGR